MRTDRTQRRKRRLRIRRRRRVALLVLAAVLIVAGTVGAALLGPAHSRPRAALQARPARLARRVEPLVVPPPGPIPGYLLIADRGNNRILLVDSRKRIIWRYPGAGSRTAAPFRYDDDAFFAPGYSRIISNQEDQDTVEVLAFPSGKLLWSYGHANVRSGAAGFLNTPDDAYLLPNGLRSVADAYNCRVVFLSGGHRIVRTIGTTGVCHHDPPSTLGAVNGATPLPNGDTLVSEIAGAWIDDVTRAGLVRWSFQAPVSYPSDPQPLPGGHILLADYARPGHVVILDHHGNVLWRYGPAAGPGALDHPSLALPLGHGLIAVNDDYRDRVVLISIRTHRIVWQYGHTDQKGTAAGYLDTPDGMDLMPSAVALRSKGVQSLLRALAVPAASTTAAARPTGPQLAFTGLPDLPAPVQRAVAASAAGRILIAGGLDTAQTSTNGVFSLNPATGRLVSLGTVPLAFHDAAGAVIGGRLFVFGGGAASSSDAVQAFDLRTHRGRLAARLPRALSDLTAARIGSRIFLIGGYDGVSARPSIYVTTDGVRFRLLASLPVGLRYPAVGAVNGRLIVAGGQTQTGLSAQVYSVDPTTGKTTSLGLLPQPVGQAAAVVEGETLFVVGGRTASGSATRDVTAVDVTNGTIRASAVLPRAVADAAVAQLGATWYLLGGWRGVNLAQVVAVRVR
jgi:outer membrane protein assembly factor BamB